MNRIISFDVGIRNMAYCIFVMTADRRLSVIDWNIINLLDKPEVHVCSCSIQSKRKASAEKPCSKKAAYTKNGQYFCQTHAKSQKDWLLPQKQYTLGFLKKQKVAEVETIYRALFPDITVAPNKPAMMDAIAAYYTAHTLDEIRAPAKKTANDVDLISIGWSIKREFDALKTLEGITHVIIENQISPIATRMKTIQGMLTQYFIMRFTPALEIAFVSSSNKLKTGQIGNSEEENKYKKNKKNGVDLCSRYLANNPDMFAEWKEILNTRKKDDLADCFLQGIWFLLFKKRITCAENLKINSV
jgi:hypothetical protein